MAGKMKDRVFEPYEGSSILGVASYDVKLPNGNFEAARIVGPKSFEAFVEYLSSPTLSEKEKAQAYTFHWRGKEAMAAQRVRLLNDTVVTIPGTNKALDLMAIPPEIACRAINAHDLGIKVLSGAAAALEPDADEDENEEMDEDSERAARKNRAWNNARRFLLESGKAIVLPDETLAVNPDYVAQPIAGSSDADVNIVNTFLDTVTPAKRKRK